MVLCPYGPPNQPSATKYILKTVRGYAPPAAENNFVLRVGGTDVQQHVREIHQHLSDAMTLLNILLQTKVGGFKEAPPSSYISRRRINDGWLHERLALGRILEKEGKPLSGANIGGGWCCSWLAW